MIKNFEKYAFLLYFGGSLYITIEVIYRGYSHWSMGIVGGICFVICGGLNNWFEWRTPFWVQIFTATAIITALEFASGVLLNIKLGLGIWDYSQMPLNLFGQICLPFTGMWLLLSAVAIVLDDVIRWRFFGEEKPRYYIF